MSDEKRPESALDRALAALDAGLQRSTEGGEGLGDPDHCTRCLSEPRAAESEFCERCRAFLLEDTTVDPSGDCGNPACPVHGDGSFRTGIAVFSVGGPAEDVDRVTELVQELVPTFVASNERALDASVAVVRLVPPELLQTAADLEAASLAAEALGLSAERCAEVVDEELERAQESLGTLVERVECRLRHEVGACACASGGSCACA